MIALTIIGAITSLLPVAFNNLPNENAMKFKKANVTLAKVINELVTSEKYYKVICLDIDITNNDEDPFGYGVRADGKILLGKRAEEWSQKSLQDKE